MTLTKKTIAKRIEECWRTIRQVKDRQKLHLLSRLNTLLMVHGKPSKDLFDGSIRHTTMPDGSVVTHTAEGISAGGGEAMTTKHPGLTIIALLLLASTVDWLASVIFGGAL